MGLTAGFGFEAKGASIIAAPLAGITILARMFLRFTVILRDIH